MKKYMHISLIIIAFLSAFLFSSCSEEENLIEDTFYMIQNNVLQPSAYFTFEKIDGVMHWSDSDGESGTCYSYTNNSAKFGIIQEVNADQTYRLHVTITATVEKSGRMKMILHVEERNVDLTPYYLCNSKYRPDNLYYHIVYYDTLTQKIVKQDEYNEIRYYPKLKDSNMYFAGWYLSSLYANKAEVGSKIKDTLILYSKWEELNDDNSVTISFETNGGSSVKPIKAPKNGDVTTPVITKEGYKFEGWYVDEELTREFINTASEDKTLYAKWSEAVRIRFLNYDGTVLSDEMVKKGNSIYYGKQYPTREADETAKYSFIGWDKELAVATEDQDFIAQYEATELGFRYQLSSTKDYYIVTDYIEKENQEEIIVPEEYNNLPIKEIATGAFKKLHIKKITVGPNVVKINMSAIDECYNLETLVLPFAGDKEYEENESYPYPLSYIFGTTEFANSTSVRLINKDFANRYFLENDIDIIIRRPDLSNTYFYLPNTLENVVITDSKYIPFYCFGSTNVKNVVLPDDCDIEGYAFDGCHRLETINIPSCVKSIKEGTFWWCNSLKTIILPEHIEDIGKIAFATCEALESINIPNGVTGLGEAAFTSCKSLTRINIPNTVKSIGSQCFSGCESLVSINVSNEVTIIDIYAFSGCVSLESIIVPNGVTTINNYAFSGCKKLKSIVLPNTIQTISELAFYGLNDLVVYYQGDTENKTIIGAIESRNPSMNLTWYCFTDDGTNETRSGNWWYYDSDGNIVEVKNN